MNSIIIKGRLTQDPELKQTPSGTAVCTVNVAVDRPYSKDKETTTDFFTVVFWQQAAEFVSNYFAKGREILVQGEMQSRKFTDRDGNNRTVWEVRASRVEFCGSKPSGDDSAARPVPAKKSAKKGAPKEDPSDGGEDDDDSNLPF